MTVTFTNLGLNCLLAETQLLGTGEERQRPWQSPSWFPAFLLVDWRTLEGHLPCRGLQRAVRLQGTVGCSKVWSAPTVFPSPLIHGSSARGRCSLRGPLGCSWLTRLCASYCNTAFHSSLDIYCTVCNIAIPLGETSENVIPWHSEASYFGYFGVKSVQMFEYNLEYILASTNLLHCSEARIA